MRYKMHETAFVGSSSDGLDDPMSSPIAMNLDRYNSRDGRSMCFHLMFIKSTCVIGDQVDLVSTASTHDASHDLIQRSILPEIRELVPHGGN